jgi:hypothetical protein
MVHIRLSSIGWLVFASSCAWALLVLAVPSITASESLWNATYAVCFTALGAIILSRQPINKVGMLLLTAILLAVSDSLEWLLPVGRDSSPAPNIGAGLVAFT